MAERAATGPGFVLDAAPEVGECARLLAAAFAEEPAVRWICGGAPAVREHWFAATLTAQAGLPGGLRCVARPAGGGGAAGDGVSAGVGAVVLTPPGAAPGPAAQAAWLARTVRRCGPAPAVRTLRYLHRAEALAPADAWTLEFVGVRPEAKGRGVGRLLLEWALDAVPSTPGGVYLTTADPDNVPLYRRFGFELLERLPVGPVEVAAMWRPG
ncbi:GNAT family N-acetyltransferase [Kitasatospora sp. NPDC054939]